MARVGRLRAARRRAVLPVLLGLTVTSVRPGHAEPGVTVLELVADRDDDDANGVPDGEESLVAPGARVDTVALDAAWVGAKVTATSGAEHARLLVGGHPVPWGERVRRGSAVQGLSPGVVEVEARRGDETRLVSMRVTAFGFRDGEGRDVDLTLSHASLDRAPPSRFTGDGAAAYDAPDPLRVFIVTPSDVPPSVTLESVGPSGAHVDALEAPALRGVPCPEAGPRLRCLASDPIRFVIDEVDRRHALAAARSLRVELGGAVVLRQAGGKAQAIRVLGPRKSPAGPIGRLRATLRPFVLRLAPGGVPAIGGNDAGAATALRAELANAATAWAECGVGFGPLDETAVYVVDPPPPHLLALGDDLGLPASGGRIRLRVDGRRVVEVPTRRGELPVDVGGDVARAVERAGFVAVVSPNARVGSAAIPSVDVSVRDRRGGLVRLEQLDLGTPVSDDPTLAVRIGAVELEDGLAHFGDVDSVAGTLEERTLLRALDDGDPSTIEVVVVPYFTGGGRIGESFIGGDRTSLRNAVILDRAGVRARRSSLTLAHELGHVLLDISGHPDDYGVDTPTRLMDADASDASPFGPRRLTLAECARVVRESGPGARLPLLRDWPLAPLVYRGAAPP